MASEEQTRGRKQLWGKTRFAHERDTIKKALELRLKTEGPKPTLKYILGQLTQSQNSEDKLSQLHCFVYIVYALFHHSRHGGLNPTQIEKLAKMGSALLRSEGILPISSQLSFLYHDLYLALSHVAHNEGRLWDAAWKNEMAIYLSQRAEQNETLDSLLQGLQCFRLGLGRLASEKFEKIISNSETSPLTLRAKLELVRIYRISGTLDAAEQLYQSSMETTLPIAERNEFEWEKTCLEVARTNSLENMMRAVLRNGTHHSYSYILEAFLWSRAVKSKKWLLSFHKITRMGQDLKLEKHQHGFLYDCAEMLESSYDTQIPFLLRFEKMGKILAQTHLLKTVDKELLLWAASARWLNRSHSTRLATMVLHKYRAISLHLSDGKCVDALGIMGDLMGSIASYEKLPLQGDLHQKRETPRF